ncbi:MAG: hypothetical protein ACJAT4_003226 [Granulosicoccus sp.]|jgi:hypothetical protein
MKKPILLLISFLIFSQNIFSQDNDSDSQGEHDQGKYSEVGLNATSFINEFISLNSNDATLLINIILVARHFGLDWAEISVRLMKTRMAMEIGRPTIIASILE